MTELLSKDHTILERPFMEFQPFGVDERGQKILDSSGVVVRANVEYLEECVGRQEGPEAAARIIQKLCTLLNDRIRDSVYHVTPELLRNDWNSYSYEFTAYLREFCKQLSGDPRFHFNIAADRIVPPLIQILGRPFPLQQIFRMYPHFGQKYAKGVVEFGVGEVTDRSAVLRQRFTERGLRQLGPYLKACAQNVCDQVKGGMCAVPEKIHGLPRATVRDLQCMVNGDGWCEWEFTWTPPAKRRWWCFWEKTAKPHMRVDEGLDVEPVWETPLEEAETPSGITPGMQDAAASESPGPLSKEHTILERPFMKFRPFGIDEHGQMIRDVSGVPIASNVDYLEEYITTRTNDPQAGARAVQELCRLLNERIEDSAYHVTPAFLKNVWHSYSYEFTSFLREFCVVLSRDQQFHFNMAKARNVPPMLQILGRPFALSQIYKMWPYFAQKYAKGSLILGVGAVTDHSAVLRLKFTERTYKQFDPYRKRCAELVCQTCKGGLLVVPEKVHGLPPATVRDLACIVNGDEWCEWEFTWTPEKRTHMQWPVWELLAGSAAFGYLRMMYPSVSGLEALGICLAPALVSWMVTRRSLQARVERLQELIKEQDRVVDARHEELREAYLEQEQKTVELRRKVNQLTTLHRQIEELNVGLEAKVRERTAELERLNQVLKTANEQLQELDRLKNEFFANVSHEFRTPLTLSLGSFNKLLKMSPTIKAREQIQMGLRNTTRLLFLINEFLDLAKFDSGLVKLKKQCIDFAALVRAVAANFESAERRRVHFQGASAPVPIEADLGQMKKVLYNLLSNAFKFSDPDRGEVWIRLASKGDRVELEVEDNGIGIPHDQLNRIFERFAQVERRATRRYEGTGIGLALVKEMVTSHGGTISVESDLGRGSTFIISLPRGAASADAIVTGDDDGSVMMPVFEEKSPERTSPVADVSEAGSRPLVLVVDDNPDMRGYLARLLSNQYQIILAKDGIEGLEQVKTFHPELVLTDLMMPRMSGHDLLKAVRADDALRATPVVFLTARAGMEARVESLEAGADDYIAKPFDENEILARVNNLIRLRTQERELIGLQREKMTRFMPVQLADVIFSDRADEVLASHRAEITVVFIDLRGFTAFAETAEPEDVMTVLQEYQTEIGRLIAGHHGVIERFSGDAIMIFLNDPVPVPNHAEQAVRLAIAMRGAVEHLKQQWRQRGIDLGAGIGVATGYATLGLVGFEQRKDYAAIGAVTNLAARLCGEAHHGQILISERVRHFVKDLVHAESVGALTLKGFHKPVTAYNVAGLAEGRPAGGNGKTKKRKRG